MTGDPNDLECMIVEKYAHRSNLIYAKKIHSEKTKFQEIGVYENPVFGRMLTLDGVLQFAQSDEFLYHEALVQPAMHISKPKNVLILGGGDGCAAREALMHSPEGKVVLVDIDEGVTGTCKKYFGGINRGSLEDEGLELIIGDAKEFLESDPRKFDVIISDITDPEVVGDYFYGAEFIGKCKNMLSGSGVFVTQAGPAGYNEPSAKAIYEGIRGLFRNCALYSTPYIGSFSLSWGFVMCSDSAGLERIDDDGGNCGLKHRYFSGRMYDAMRTFANVMENRKVMALGCRFEVKERKQE